MMAHGSKATASKDTIQLEGRIVNDAAVDFVTKGTKLIKVRSKFSKNERHFLVDPNDLFLTYKGSKKQRCFKSRQANRIYLSDVQEVRSGCQSDGFDIAYGLNHHFPQDSQCFSLVIGEEGKMLDLVARNVRERDLWISGIEECRQRLKFKSSNPAEIQQQWAKKLFREADKDGNGVLSRSEIIRLLNQMNLDIDESDIAKVVISRTLNSDDFLKFLKEILQKQEIVKEIFKKYDKGHMYWTKHDLHQFMKQEQEEELTLDQCEKIISETETCPDLQTNHFLGLTGFMKFFESDQMSIRNPVCDKIYQDMDQPLSHYFIDSSHNTYLESDQLQGYSKVECYVKALKSGCRCVEMDVWDGDEMQPVICHGFTLTSKILFSDVIEVINKYAFCISKFPLILSIENHCSVEQQRIMAITMKKVFGKKLFLDDLIPNSNYLPPPSHLMERIIIKCKKNPDTVKMENTTPIEMSIRITAAAAAVGTAIGGDESDEDKNDAKEDEFEIATEFSECINICQTAPFKSFLQSKETQNFTYILSFNEAKALKLAKQTPEQFIEHNKRQLSRIYPSGSRFGSSNYDPVPFWTVGCQVVALNYQTSDESMQLNRGLFSDNGRCGYILKPEFMRSFSSKSTFSPDGFVPNSWHQTLKFRVLSGFCLPKKEGDGSKSILDPYVQVTVTGVPRDRKTVKTKVISNNGFHPVWNEEFQFFISCPQLALLHLQVFDHETKRSNVVIAQYCLPIRCIQKGYRTVHLKTVGGEKLFSAKLYVHITIS